MKYILMLSLVLFSTFPAFAQDSEMPLMKPAMEETKGGTINVDGDKVTVNNGEPLTQESMKALRDRLDIILKDKPTGVTLTKQKTPYSVKHPKIHKHWRGARKKMQKATPYIQFGGACINTVANVVTALRVH